MKNNYIKEKQISGCAVFGIMNQSKEKFCGDKIIKAISVMHERSNGLGGGFAAYGIYPEFKEFWCFHIIYENEKGKQKTEEYIEKNFLLEKKEKIPTAKSDKIINPPLLWRYFLKEKKENIITTVEDYIVSNVMYINSKIPDAFVASSGKNMGIFKGVGYPEDIGKFFRLDEYEGYIWTAHGRFPTNSVAWWGGAHPFGLLDWSIVHNGEISSYGINKRYLENFDYQCSFFTDTEVITYLVDLIIRKHNLSFETLANILAAPLWSDIERMNEEEKQFYTNLRIIYSSALLNGPFAIIVANSEIMFGLNDRIKLRPLVSAIKDDFLFISSEECAIREICTSPDKVWRTKVGEPTIGRINKKNG
ncbi:MAG TPA: glutamine amidotransferase family protein [bacterium]|nr:glutamine amidotransferase family protein [bacterium]HOL48213.1 glutamine amidotransferase family protein [bacterium]HPQ19198.1 glutamine amidotransferase family protein [bacterium]